jgi:lysozyme family protein
VKILLAIPIFAALVVSTSQLYRYTGETQVQRWNRAKIKQLRLREVDGIVDRITANKARYDVVQGRTGVPFHIIAFLHNMEASGSFSKHLHEGSSLTGRTRWVPKGRPVKGTPPFKWEDSAVDALAYDKMDKVDWSSLESSLNAIEGYNGWGVAKYHSETPTAYLYGGSDIYRKGKYVADSKWDSQAVSGQIGVAVIWKRMIQRSLLPNPTS